VQLRDQGAAALTAPCSATAGSSVHAVVADAELALLLNASSVAPDLARRLRLSRSAATTVPHARGGTVRVRVVPRRRRVRTSTPTAAPSSSTPPARRPLSKERSVVGRRRRGRRARGRYSERAPEHDASMFAVASAHSAHAMGWTLESSCRARWPAAARSSH
jgi:hypothetical protein